MIYSLGVYSESIGIVLSAVDKVIAEQGNAKRILSRGSPIFTGDSIITGSSARAQIKYTNGALVSIDSNSHYKTVHYAPKSDITIKSKLTSGSIDYDSNAKTKKKSVLETPVVALAILGTRLQVKVSADNTALKVTKGKVCVDNPSTNTIEEPCLGPDQTVSSGVFDRDKKFTPGDTIVHPVSNIAVEINQTVTEVSLVNTINSTAQTIQQLTQIADIVILP